MIKIILTCILVCLWYIINIHCEKLVYIHITFESCLLSSSPHFTPSWYSLPIFKVYFEISYHVSFLLLFSYKRNNVILYLTFCVRFISFCITVSAFIQSSEHESNEHEIPSSGILHCVYIMYFKYVVLCCQIYSPVLATNLQNFFILQNWNSFVVFKQYFPIIHLPSPLQSFCKNFMLLLHVSS